MKRISACLLLLCLLCSCTVPPQKPSDTTDKSLTETAEYTPRPDELRAVWISCYELPDAAQGEENSAGRRTRCFAISPI